MHQFFICCPFNKSQEYIRNNFYISIPTSSNNLLTETLARFHINPYKYAKIRNGSLTFSLLSSTFPYFKATKRMGEFEKDRINTNYSPFLLISGWSGLSRIEHCVIIDHPFKDIRGKRLWFMEIVPFNRIA